ncbi:MAG TPA: ABC transporter permease subunit [Thermoanaerobaculia bacterium]|nr:ABC transporter permease subunit [Thermoanaerobaculia bacterium]
MEPRRQPSRTAPGRLWADRVARWLVTAGGLAIIASILGILLFILLEVWPLTGEARVTRALELAQPEPPLAAVVVDEHRTHVAGLGADGVARARALADGRQVAAVRVAPEGARLTDVWALPGRALTAALGGRVLAVPVAFPIRFEGSVRLTTPEIGEPVVFDLAAAGAVGAYAVDLDGDGGGSAAAQVAGGDLVLVRRSVRENLLSGETTESAERWQVPVSYPLSRLVLDGAGRNLYAGTPGGEVLWWRVGAEGPGALQVVSAGEAGVSELAQLIGDRSLAVGQEDGSLSVWFPVARPQGGERLTRIRSFPPPSARAAGAGRAIVAIARSPRDKGFLAADAAGGLGLYHSSSDRLLWRGPAGAGRPLGLAYGAKADSALVAGAGVLAGLAIANPHPEITWRTLFGKVWYEGYPRPELVWQSSSGTQTFEPKLSLTPLLVGTLKGTFYSLLLAIPLGILGAMYLSQFMHPAYKRQVKPVIEIMAALPSVVLGFLAGLWLAPRLEGAMPALMLMAVFLPASVLLAGWLWSLLPRRFRQRAPTGTEMFAFAAALVAAAGAAVALGPWLEATAFGGSFQSWLLAATGLPYDQRNAVVIGIAMGFAVIPIIFAISEDAFSNVPPNLVAGSLALGANRWQTVTRVVLPTASPGIFSAVMIGFGRAVGETMIVLMATGNTPIMSWNPFNGFRTLSANIAVEIPEAPQGGTLYRTLFLAALLLFALTFLVNTVAELVRQRLRQRYSRL